MMPGTGSQGKGPKPKEGRILPYCTLQMSSPISVASASSNTAGGGVEVGGHHPDGRSSGEEKPNPALSPVLLKELFRSCPVELLASCRLVCRAWYRESHPTWRATATPKFTFTKEFPGRITIRHKMDDPASRSQTGLHCFLDFWIRNCRTQPQPYQKFQLEEWPFGGVKAKDETIQARKERLLLDKLLRNNATSLTLRQCEFVDAEEFRRVVYTGFPKLESLVLHFPIFPKAVLAEPEDAKVKVKKGPVYKDHLQLTSLTLNCYGLEHLPVSCVELLSHFPSLTTLKLGYLPQMYDYWPCFRAFAPNIQVLLDGIDIMRRVDPAKLPLKRFEVEPCLGLSNDDCSKQIFALLRRLNLPISAIRINVDCGLKLMEEFITSHGRTLAKFEVLKDDYDNRFLRWASPSPAFPFGVELTSLQELTIGHGLVDSLEFLKYTPNLVRLRMFDILEDICGRDKLVPLEVSLFSSTSKEDLAQLKLEGLKTLYFGYSLSEDDLRWLVRWFPNVENLTMFLDDDKFAMVCENWGSLAHLHVLGKYLTDQGITGRRVTPGTGNESGAEPEAIRPNIADLKDLRCVKVEPTCLPLTDASALHGFLKLPKLESLDISQVAHQFGKEVQKALARKVRNCSISCSIAWVRQVNKRDWCVIGSSDSV